MSFIDINTGKQISLSKGYESRTITYDEWRRQQEEKRAAGGTDSHVALRAPRNDNGGTADTSGEAWTRAAPSQTRVPERAEAAPVTEKYGQGRTRAEKGYSPGRERASRQYVKPAGSHQTGKDDYRETWAQGLTGTERRERREDVHRQLADLDRQARQARVDLDTDALNRISDRGKELRASIGEQTAGDRAGDVLTAILFGSAGQNLNNLGTAQELAGAARRNYLPLDIEQKERELERYLENARTAEDEEVRQYWEYEARRAREAIAGYREGLKDSETQGQDTYALADRLSGYGAKARNSAAEGLGRFGTDLVDAAISTGQSVADNTVGRLTGTGLFPFIARAFGGAAQEARQGGADLEQQLVYSTAQAAKEYIGEKLFGIAVPQRISGSGGFGSVDEGIEKVIRYVTDSLAGTPGGKKVLGGLLTWGAGGATEALEGGFGSLVENLFINPCLRGWDPDTRTGREKLDDAIHDMYLEGLGGLLGVTNLLGYQAGGNTPGTAQGQAETAAGAETRAPAGVDAPSDRGGLQGVQEAPAAVPVQRNVLMETAARGGRLEADTGHGVSGDVVVPGETAGQQNTVPGTGTAREYHGQIIDTIRANLDKVKGMDSVVELTGQEFQKTAGDNRPLRQKVIEFFNSIGNKVFRPGMGDIELNMAGAKDSTAHGYGKLKAATFAALPSVLEKGTLIYKRSPYEGHDYDSYIISAPVKVNGTTCYVGALVIRDANMQRYKLHEVLTTNENGAPLFKSETHSYTNGRLSSGTPLDGEAQTNPTSLAAESGAGAQAPLSEVEGTRPLNSDPTITQPSDSVKARGADPLMEAIFSTHKRVDQSTLTPEQFDLLADLNEQGAVGMDAAGRVYQVDPAEHIDRRSMDGVAGRGLNAFSFDHPELHDYFKRAAEALIADADLSMQFPAVRRYERGAQGRQVSQGAEVSAHLRQAMDETGLSRAQLIDAAKRIVEDHGQENAAAAKRVEIILDDMLENGWTAMTGESVPPNQAYLDAKAGIAGSRPKERSGYLDGVDELNALPENAGRGMMESGDTAMEKARLSLKEETELGETREETRAGFKRRADAEGYSSYEGERFTYGYRPIQWESAQENARQILEEVRNLGIEAEIIEGDLLSNRDGITRIKAVPQAVTVEKSRIFINNNADLPPRNTAGHEAFHLWKNGVGRDAYIDVLEDNLLFNSEAFRKYQSSVAEAYLGGEADLSDPKQRAALMEELFAYLSGDIHEGVNDEALRPMFRDYDAVKAAWEALVGGAGSDGLGAADAGSLSSAFERLQAQSDTFHPEGANAARPVDVPTKDLDGYNIPKSASTMMGAQVLRDADVRQLEQMVSDGILSFGTIHDGDAIRYADHILRDKGFDAALEQYRNSARANVATKGNVALGQLLMRRASAAGNGDALAEIVTLYAANSTTIAQAMQAQSLLRKLPPESQLAAVQKTLNALNEKYGTDVQIDGADAQAFLEAGDAEAREAVRQEIVEKAAKALPSTFKAKFDTWRYLSMLGNPRTHIRNITGNLFFQPLAAAKNRVGALEEVLLNSIGGGKVERTKSLVGANPFGKLAREARADWANAEEFLGRTSKYMEGQTSLWEIEQRANPFQNSNPVGKGIGWLAEKNGALLEAEDTLFKRWIYSQSLAGYLQANGVKSIDGADPALLNRARNYAAQEALRNTFNDKNQFSDAVVKLGRGRNDPNPFIKGAGYLVEGVLPFKRTPANVLARGVEYSPVGAVTSMADLVYKGVTGKATAETVTKGLDRLAAGISGSVLLAAGFLLGGAGYITGGEGEDKDQGDFDDLTGHQNYALELKNGTSVTLDWMAPEAIPFFMGVEFQKAMIDRGLSVEDAKSVLTNTAEPMLEMSMLQGLNDIFESAAYAENKGGSVLWAVVSSAFTNYFTQALPTLFGQLERTAEDRRMTTYTDKNSSIPKDTQYLLGKAGQKIPGWDYQQIPYIDAWGREEETGDPLERAVKNLFNPAYISQVQVDEVEQELQRVKDVTGDGGVFPERAPRFFQADGARKDLTAEEYLKYSKARGQESYRMVKEGLSLPEYQGMTDQERAGFIADLYQYADQTAKQGISNYEVYEWVKNAQNAQRDIGVSPAEYIALYRMYGSRLLSGPGYDKTKQAVEAGLTVEEYAGLREGLDADGNGTVSQEEARGALDRSGFSQEQKADLWEIINKSWKRNPYA